MLEHYQRRDSGSFEAKSKQVTKDASDGRDIGGRESFNKHVCLHAGNDLRHLTTLRLRISQHSDDVIGGHAAQSSAHRNLFENLFGPMTKGVCPDWAVY